jgi:hypothetical protein
VVRRFYAKLSFFRISATICCGLAAISTITARSGSSRSANWLARICSQPLCDQVGTSPQVRTPDCRPDLKFLSVDTLQGGARQNDIVTRGDPIGDRRTKTLQPPLPVVVAERDSVPKRLHKSSASANLQPSCSASNRPTVVFPAPTTRITITIIGGLSNRSAGRLPLGCRPLAFAFVPAAISWSKPSGRHSASS